jgi:ribonucleotide monophosphatase NagD (HAD superfamily)
LHSFYICYEETYQLLNYETFGLASGGGSMVGAILGSTKQEPLVVGKPSTFMMDYLAKK